MVVDTSAILAVMFNEPGASWVAEMLSTHRRALRMSTVNLGEVLILLRDRQPQLAAELGSEIIESSIRFVPPTIRHAELAAQAHYRFPLNLGDCFAYALAKEEACPILTLERDFKRTDIEVCIPRR